MLKKASFSEAAPHSVEVRLSSWLSGTELQSKSLSQEMEAPIVRLPGESSFRKCRRLWGLASLLSAVNSCRVPHY